MKKAIFIVIIPLMFFGCNPELLKQISEQATGGNGGNPLTNDEIIAGLKEALEVGTKNSVSFLSKIDGFYKNPEIKIPFPPEAKNVENKVRGLGLNKMCDDFIISLNRAAEDAAKSAVPVFVNAIKEMTISDGLKILNGADNEATKYLKEKTYNKLKEKFKPIVKKSIEKVNVTKYWKPVINKYNQIPLTKPVNPDLVDYTTNKAINGLFVQIAKEEKKIRENPAARITDLLKRVFG